MFFSNLFKSLFILRFAIVTNIFVIQYPLWRFCFVSNIELLHVDFHKYPKVIFKKILILSIFIIITTKIPQIKYITILPITCWIYPYKNQYHPRKIWNNIFESNYIIFKYIEYRSYLFIFIYKILLLWKFYPGTSFRV